MIFPEANYAWKTSQIYFHFLSITSFCRPPFFGSLAHQRCMLLINIHFLQSWFTGKASNHRSGPIGTCTPCYCKALHLVEGKLGIGWICYTMKGWVMVHGQYKSKIVKVCQDAVSRNCCPTDPITDTVIFQSIGIKKISEPSSIQDHQIHHILPLYHKILLRMQENASKQRAASQEVASKRWITPKNCYNNTSYKII